MNTYHILVKANRKRQNI